MAVAEENPSVGIVSAYVLQGPEVKCVGLPYQARVFAGREICRRHLLDHLYVFESANALLYRSDLVCGNAAFYNEKNIHADTEACFALLRSADFGFVHQILTYTRIRPGSERTTSSDLQTYLSGMLQVLQGYGLDYLSSEELDRLLRAHISDYYKFLGKCELLGQRNVLNYHRAKLIDSGIGFQWSRVAFGMMLTLLSLASRPGFIARRLMKSGIKPPNLVLNRRRGTVPSRQAQSVPEERNERGSVGLTNSKALRIGLLDHMGYGNLGDAATQDVAIANIRKRLPDTTLIGFSFVPSDTTARHGIPCYPIRRWYPKSIKTGDSSAAVNGNKSRVKEFIKSFPFAQRLVKPILEFGHQVLFLARSYRAVRTLDVLIISGGGQLTDLWRGPWSHPYSVFQFCLFAKLAGRKLYILNVGAGPLDHRLSKFFAKHAVQLADYCSFRDDESQALIHSLGVKSKTHVYPDLAYALQIEEIVKSTLHDSSVPVVGLNPIGFCDPRNWARKDEAIYRKYLQKIVRFSVWLLQQGYILRIFTNEASLDKYVIEDLRAELRLGTTPEMFGRISWSTSETVNEVLREMSEFDFVVTSKYHGIVFSQVLGKPVISLSYHMKMDSAMQALGQERFNANIEGFDVDWLINAFRLLLEESEGIRWKSATVVKEYAARLSQQFDRLLLPESR